MKLTWPPGAAVTVTTGLAVAVGGLAIQPQAIGYSISAAAVVGALAVYRLLIHIHDGRRKLRARATEIVKGLIWAGNRLQHQHGYTATLTNPTTPTSMYSCSSDLVLPAASVAPEKSHQQQVEDWREVVGNKLHGAPFTSTTYDFVMDKSGHRLNVPMLRLRDILADIDRWVNYGD